MIFDYGDKKNPTGNAIIYWIIKGDNPHFSKGEIIATNFVISPLQFNEETLMVNFPPVIVKSFEELLHIAEIHNVDLIRGGELYIPKNISDIHNFYKKQIEKYNGLMQEYLIAFKEKLKKDRDNESIPHLINKAHKLMEEIRKEVKSKEPGDKPGDKFAKIEDRKKELRIIEEKLNRQMKGFNFSRIIYLIDRPEEVVDHLVELYHQKFLAIFLEDYEKAGVLKEMINEIENLLLFSNNIS